MTRLDPGDPPSARPLHDTPDGLRNPARTLAMLAITLGLGLSTMDGLIANVALPTLSREFGVAPSAAVWIVNAYQLALVCTLLPCASLGEIYGYRRVYLYGLVGFTLTSVACAASHSLDALIVARTLQGVAAAAILSVNSALVRHIWPRAQLGRGIGINAVVAAGGFALGPTVASAILSIADWTWLFAANVPLGAAAFALGARALPDVAPRPGRFDPLSALLTALVFVTAAGGLHFISEPDARSAAMLLLAGATLLGFILCRRETRSDAPLFPIDLLRIPLFRLSVLTSICAFSAAALALVALPFHLQAAMNWPAAQVGFLIAPWPFATACTALVSGRLADRYPPGPLGGVGLTVFAAALLSATVLTAAGPLIVGCCLVMCGIGFGLFQTPNNRALLSAAPLHRSGGASGMLGVSRSVGLALGATLAALAFQLGSNGMLAAFLLALLAAVISLVRR